MLIPSRILSALSAPLTHFIRLLLIIRKQHSAGGTRNYFISVETDNSYIAERARLSAVVCSAETFGGVLDNSRAVFVSYGTNLV